MNSGNIYIYQTQIYVRHMYTYQIATSSTQVHSLSASGVEYTNILRDNIYRNVFITRTRLRLHSYTPSKQAGLGRRIVAIYIYISDTCITRTRLRPHKYTPSRQTGLGRRMVAIYIYIRHIYTYQIATSSTQVHSLSASRVE